MIIKKLCEMIIVEPMLFDYNLGGYFFYYHLVLHKKFLNEKVCNLLLSYY